VKWDLKSSAGLAISLLVVLEVTGQAPPPVVSFQLQGQLTGRDTGSIVLWYPDSTGTYIRDTAAVRSGQFFFSGWLRHPSYAHLIGSKRKGNYASFYLEGGGQTIRLAEDSFENVTMTGSRNQQENRLLYQVLDSLEQEIKNSRAALSALRDRATISQPELPDTAYGDRITALEKSIQAERIRFIQSHPHSYVSATELLGIIGILTIQKADSLLSHLNKDVRESKAGLLCRVELEKKRSLRAGNRFPLLSTTTVNGDSIRLAEITAPYVLIDFWASWCVPCRKAVPALMETYRTYRPKGFEVLAISVDKDRQKWVEAIEKDGTGAWIHINQDTSLAPLFQAVQVVPTQVLLDGQKNIIWSSLEENAKHWTDVLKEKLL
jgi:thiol-disulfide isomerase/thioredoxin